MIGETLLSSILADPDDDAVRLVYADWLEQQGNVDRANLIRLQCAAESLKGKARSAVEKQAKALIRSNRGWVAEIRKTKLAKRPVFRRGFLHGITLPAYRFVEVAAELFETTPTLRSVIFPLPLDEIDKLIACPYVERLTAADLCQFCQCNWCKIDTQIREVFRSPCFANLTYLRTSGNRIDAEGARVVAESTSLPNLRELDLSDNQLGNDGARLLLDAEWLSQLTRINLRKNDIGPRVLAALKKRFGRALIA